MKKRLLGAFYFISLFLAPAIVFAATGDPGTPGAAPLPEPTSLLLIASGLIGVWGFRRISKK